MFSFFHVHGFHLSLFLFEVFFFSGFFGVFLGWGRGAFWVKYAPGWVCLPPHIPALLAFSWGVFSWTHGGSQWPGATQHAALCIMRIMLFSPSLLLVLEQRAFLGPLRPQRRHHRNSQSTTVHSYRSVVAPLSSFPSSVVPLDSPMLRVDLLVECNLMDPSSCKSSISSKLTRRQMSHDCVLNLSLISSLVFLRYFPFSMPYDEVVPLRSLTHLCSCRVLKLFPFPHSPLSLLSYGVVPLLSLAITLSLQQDVSRHLIQSRENAPSSKVDACETCGCPKSGELKIFCFGSEKPEVAHEGVTWTATTAQCLKCSGICRCQSGHQTNTTLHTILTQPRITSVMPMLVMATTNASTRPKKKSNTNRCNMLSALPSRARKFCKKASTTRISSSLLWCSVAILLVQAHLLQNELSLPPSLFPLSLAS